MDGEHGGVYRGIVEDVADPEERKRYRVRVVNIHRDEITASRLPWAELCIFGGKGFGDIPHYEVGDGVIVQFEGGNRRFPWIMGGWVAQAGGTSDLPSEQTGEYERTQRRWVRYDRNGQKIVMDEEQQILELTSGKSTVSIRGGDGAIVIQTDGVVEVRSPRVDVIEATNVNVESVNVFAEIAELATLNCAGVVTVRGGTEINVGEYVTDNIPPQTNTTPIVNIKAATTVNVESGQDTNITVGTTTTLTSGGDILMDGAANFTIDGKARVHVLSEGACDVEAEQINLTSTGSVITLNAASSLMIDVNNDASITVGGQATVDIAGSLTATVQGSADVDVTGPVTLNSSSNVTVTASGIASIESDVVIDLKAPVINLEATSTLNLDSDGVALLHGTTVLIGT